MSASWKIFAPAPNNRAIAAGLDTVPSAIALTPLQGKRPYRVGWQHEDPVSHEEIRDSILNGFEKPSKKSGKLYRAYVSGFGIRTGEVSGGVLAIDVDGESADRLLDFISAGDIPRTWEWTSGKPGRRQLAYQLPDDVRQRLTHFTRKPIRVWNDFKADADLDFRYNESQSALPPSLHPDTGSYKWIHSPADTELAIAPQWLCDLLLWIGGEEERAKAEKEAARQRREEERKQRERMRAIAPTSDALSDDLPTLLDDAKRRLTWDKVYNFEVKTQGFGKTKGFCPVHGGSSGTSFQVNEHDGTWYCFGCAQGGHYLDYLSFVDGKGTGLKGADMLPYARELLAIAGIRWEPKERSPLPSEEKREYTDEEKREWKRQQQQKQWQKCYQFTADRLIETEWVDLDPDEILGQITAIRAGMGSGKTTALIKLASAFKGKHKILYWGVSNTLLIQTAEKVKGLHFRTEDDEFFFARDPLGHHLFCIQSLHRFKPEHLEDAIIVLDEATAIIREFVDGSTLTSRPLEEQRFIESNWHDALQHSKGIIALDGYLGDRHCDYLQSVAPHLKLTKIAKPTTPKTPINFHLGSFKEGDVKSSDFSSIIKQILELTAQGKKVAIASDSQKTCEALDEMLTAMGIKGGYRIDSTTVAEDCMKSILKDPNEAILSNQVTRLIYSPSAMSGVDISVPDWFDVQFCIFHGVLSADLLSQMVWRVRHCPERHVWCNAIGFGEGGQYTPRAIERTIRFGLAQHLWDSFGDDAGTFDDWQIRLDSADCRQAYWERGKANYERANLRDCLKWLLEANGSEVIETVANGDDESSSQFKDTKNEIKEREAIAAYNAPDIDDEEYSRLKQGCTREDRPKAIRHSIKMSLPQIETDPQWGVEFIRWYLENRDARAQAKRWFLYQQQEVAQSSATESWIKRGGFRAYQYRSYLGEVRALRELGILEVFAVPRSKDDPEVQAIADRWRQDPQIRARLGGKIPAQNPIRSFNWILGLFGIRLACVEQRRGKGKKENLYQIDFGQQELEEWQAVARAVARSYEGRGVQASENCTSFGGELYKPDKTGTEISTSEISTSQTATATNCTEIAIAAANTNGTEIAIAAANTNGTETDTNTQTTNGTPPATANAVATIPQSTAIAVDTTTPTHYRGKWFEIDRNNPRPEWGERWKGYADGEPFINPMQGSEWWITINVPGKGAVSVSWDSVVLLTTGTGDINNDECPIESFEVPSRNIIMQELQVWAKQSGGEM